MVVMVHITIFREREKKVGQIINDMFEDILNERYEMNKDSRNEKRLRHS